MSKFSSSSISSSSSSDGLRQSLRQLHSLGSAEFKAELSKLSFSSATTLRKCLFSSSSSLNAAHVLTGDIRNHVRKRLCNDVSPTVTLDKVHYCVTSLSFLQSIANSSEAAKAEVSDGAYAKEIRSLINHAFLVVEMYDETKKQPLFFRAEKFGGPIPDHVGIVISEFHNNQFELLRKGVAAFTLSCDKKAVTVKQVMELLEGDEGDADYCLRDRCCWDYARETAVKLLKTCAALPNLSQQENARLQKEIDSVERQVVKQSFKNVPFIVEKYFDWVKQRVPSITF